MSNSRISLGIIRSFVSICGVPRCGREAICLPGIAVDPRGKLHRVNARQYQEWHGYWGYTGSFKYFMSRLSLAAALRRHETAGRPNWYPVCVLCIATSYVKRGNARVEGIPPSKWTMFGPTKTQDLKRIRSLKQSSRALARLLPELERIVIADLERQHSGPARRRKA